MQDTLSSPSAATAASRYRTARRATPTRAKSEERVRHVLGLRTSLQHQSDEVILLPLSERLLTTRARRGTVALVVGTLRANHVSPW